MLQRGKPTYLSTSAALGFFCNFAHLQIFDTKCCELQVMRGFILPLDWSQNGKNSAINRQVMQLSNTN